MPNNRMFLRQHEHINASIILLLPLERHPLTTPRTISTPLTLQHLHTLRNFLPFPRQGPHRLNQINRQLLW